MHHTWTKSGLGLLLLAAMLLVFGGCGDDNPPAPITTNNPVEGDLNDPVFQTVQQQINEYLQDAHELYGLGFDNIYQLPTDTETVRNMMGPFGPDDTVAAAYVDGWHVMYISRHTLSFDEFFRDSVQFRINSEAVEEPQGLDYMRFIRYWGYTDKDVDETHTNKYGHLDLEYTNLNTGACNINGFNNAIFEWNYISADSTVEAIFDMVVTTNDLSILEVPYNGWISACPVSGELTFEIDQAYSVTINYDTEFWVTSWEATVTFENGTASVEVIRNNVCWNYTHSLCTPVGL